MVRIRYVNKKKIMYFMMNLVI